MKNVLIAIGLLAVLVSGASATLRNDTQVITARTAIDAYVPDRILELGVGADYTFTTRTDMSNGAPVAEVCAIILNGGKLTIGTGMTRGLEMPDNWTAGVNGPVRLMINSGTADIARIQCWGTIGATQRDAQIVIGEGTLYVRSRYKYGTDNYNAVTWLANGGLVAAEGRTLVLEDLGPTTLVGALGNAVKITSIPEPATLSLLGLGVLAMLRKRK